MTALSLLRAQFEHARYHRWLDTGVDLAQYLARSASSSAQATLLLHGEVRSLEI